MLKEDEEAAQAEVAIAQEREQLQQAEVAELTRQRDEAKEQFHSVQEEHRQRLLPYIHELEEVRCCVLVLLTATNLALLFCCGSARDMHHSTSSSLGTLL